MRVDVPLDVADVDFQAKVLSRQHIKSVNQWLDLVSPIDYISSNDSVKFVICQFPSHGSIFRKKFDLLALSFLFNVVPVDFSCKHLAGVSVVIELRNIWLYEVEHDVLIVR